jgi:hypothetical protein
LDIAVVDHRKQMHKNRPSELVLELGLEQR